MDRHAADWSALPAHVLHAFAAWLEPEERVRAALACTRWRDALFEPSVWKHFSLSADPEAHNLAQATAALRGASRLAAGGMARLRLNKVFYALPEADLVAVLRENSGALEELHLPDVVNEVSLDFPYEIVDLVTTLRAAAPRLRAITLEELRLPAHEAAQLLRDRDKPPLDVVHAEELILDCDPDEYKLEVFEDDDEEAQQHETELTDALAALTELPVKDEQLTFRRRSEERAPAYASNAAFTDAMRAAAARYSEVRFQYANERGISGFLVTAASLTRLLTTSAVLTRLSVCNVNGLGLDADTASAFAAALRNSATLADVELVGLRMWTPAHIGTSIVAALTNHPRLQCISLDDAVSDDAGARAMGAAYGALVAANAPALRELRASFVVEARLDFSVVDGVLAPLADALPHNTHLRSLNLGGPICGGDTGMRLATAIRTLRMRSQLRSIMLGFA